MQATETSSTSSQSLGRLVRAIFRECQGSYGNRFLSQWKTGQMVDGHDAGIMNAMKTWAKKLEFFGESPEGEAAVMSVLENLPDDPPTLPQFHAMCNQAYARSRDSRMKIEHKPTADEQAKVAEAAKKARAAVSGMGDRDPLDWARHPRSEIAIRAVLDTAKTDGRFREIVQELRAKGVIDDEGHALMVWNATDGQFQRAGWRQ